MKNLFKSGLIFAIGWFAGQMVIIKDVNEGEVVINDDDKYVKAAKSRSHGWSYAKIHWKDPQ